MFFKQRVEKYYLNEFNSKEEGFRLLERKFSRSFNLEFQGIRKEREKLAEFMSKNYDESYNISDSREIHSKYLTRLPGGSMEFDNLFETCKKIANNLKVDFDDAFSIRVIRNQIEQVSIRINIESQYNKDPKTLFMLRQKKERLIILMLRTASKERLLTNSEYEILYLELLEKKIGANNNFDKFVLWLKAHNDFEKIEALHLLNKNFGEDYTDLFRDELIEVDSFNSSDFFNLDKQFIFTEDDFL